MPPRKTRSTSRNATKTTAEESATAGPLAMPDSIISRALEDAIDTMPEHRLRARMKHFCEHIPLLRREMEEEFVVPVESVTPYDATSDSEEEPKSNKRTRSGGSVNISKKRRLEQRLVALGSTKEVPKWAKCCNCKEDFDVTKNKKGACVWHSGVLDTKKFHAMRTK